MIAIPSVNYIIIIKNSSPFWLETFFHQRNNSLPAEKYNPVQETAADTRKDHHFSQNPSTIIHLCSVPPSKQNRNGFSKTLEFKQFDMVNPTLHREPFLKLLNKNSRIENGVICHSATTYISSNSFKILC